MTFSSRAWCLLGEGVSQSCSAVLATAMTLPGEQLQLGRIPALGAPHQGLGSHRTLPLGTALQRTCFKIPRATSGDWPSALPSLKSEIMMPARPTRVLIRQRADFYPFQRHSSWKPVRLVITDANRTATGSSSGPSRKASSAGCSSRILTVRSASAAEAATADEICLPINYFQVRCPPEAMGLMALSFAQV